MIFFSKNPEQSVASRWKPPADLYRTPEGWVVKCDLAGVRSEDVKVQAHGFVITVRGLRRDWVVEEGWCHYSMEISYSEFERTIDIPCNVEAATIETEYIEGMLIIRIGTGADLP